MKELDLGGCNQLVSGGKFGYDIYQFIAVKWYYIALKGFIFWAQYASVTGLVLG